MSIAGETASTYVQLRGLQERLRVARENANNQRETLNLVEARYRAGSDTDYELALKAAQAALEQADATVENTRVQAERRQKLTNLSTSVEEQQTYTTQARIAEANYAQAAANLDRATIGGLLATVQGPFSESACR